MTQRQKALVAILAIANVLVISALAVLVSNSPRANLSSLPTPSSSVGTRPDPQEVGPTQTRLATPPLLQVCQQEAAHRLARAGLGGVVTLAPEGVLRFEIIYSLAPGQTTNDAAQLIWTVLDIVSAIGEEGQCNSVIRVEAVILARDERGDTRLSASVNAADLAAFAAGKLSEDQFIERVTYTVTVGGQ